MSILFCTFVVQKKRDTYCLTFKTFSEMAQVNLTVTELIAISTLIEQVSILGKQENVEGLFIDFMYLTPTQCKVLADILQHISTETYGYTGTTVTLCKKLRQATK